MNHISILPGKSIFLSLLILLVIPGQTWSAENTETLKGNGVVVRFTEPHQGAAEEIKKIFPTVKAELEKTFGWPLDFDTTVFLSEDHESFQGRVGNNLVVAYAVPQKNLIVFDSTMMNKSPFSIGVTLKHELCHLFLHRHIAADDFPKWLDEGIAQWVSGGVAEILLGGQETTLDQASLSGKLIPIRALEKTFPGDDASFRLAYGESKSLVEFIVNTAGSDGLRNILDDLRKGASIDEAVTRELGFPHGDLERNWQRSLQGRMTWVAYMSRRLYSILFFLAGLATVAGFIRFLVRKRAYIDDDDGEGRA
jgi:Peptidase MA superfamily